MVIDFGEVRRAAASLDPVVLELSLLFHARGREISGDWPSETEATSWHDLDEYVRRSPYAALVRTCRAWAREVTDGDRAIFANAYGHAVKQLKYPDVDPGMARAIIAASIEGFART